MPRQKLNAVALKDTLWETLLQTKSGKLDPGAADAIAGQAREILRTIKVQIGILSFAKKGATQDLVEFATDKSER